MKKTLALCFAVLFLLTGCGSAKLEDGTEAVVMFKEGNINAEKLYDALKEKDGVSTLITLIDTDLLAREYTKTEEEEDYIDDNINSVKAVVKANEYDLDSYINYYYGVKSVKELKEYFRLTYRRKEWFKSYAKTAVTDKEIKTYYDSMIMGDIDLNWILVSSKASSSDDDDTKNTAEKEALKKAKEAIKDLKDKMSWESVVERYSDDTTTKDKEGSLGKVNRGDIADNLIEEALKLEVGKYSTTPIKTNEGYAILYVKAKDEKPSLDDKKESIIEKLASEKVDNDNGSLYLESLESLRSKYSMTFKDDYLSNAYTEYLEKQKSSLN